MANVIDYLKWRGDLTFAQSPFNVVDNAILSMLAYVEYRDLVPAGGEETVSLREVCAGYQAAHDPQEEASMPPAKKGGVEVLRAAAETARFGDIGLAGYESITSREAAAQMAAVTFRLSDRLACAAYRGTDNTLVGWKEDFLLGCIPETQGQASAVEYLNRHFSGNDTKLIVCGHSKGGNFAVYASAFCRPDVRGRILRVYSNDGPGFRDEVTGRPEYAEILPRLAHIIPQGSFIGTIMDLKVEPVVVSSGASGMDQHRIDSWEVMGKTFVPRSIRREARVYRDGVSRFLAGLDHDELMVFTDCLFDLLGSTGAETLRDLRSAQAVRGLLSSAATLPREQFETMMRVVGKLARSMDAAAGESLEALLQKDQKPD